MHFGRETLAASCIPPSPLSPPMIIRGKSSRGTKNRQLVWFLISCLPLMQMEAAQPLPEQTIAVATFAHPKLGDDSYAKLRLFVEHGVHEIQLHIVSFEGKNAEVAAVIVQRGGQIRFRADEIGYLRVAWSFTGVASLESLASLPEVQAIAVAYSGAREPTVTLTPNLEPKLSGDPALPLTEPYRPLIDVDGEALLHASATFDGRGVTIGQIEHAIPDLLHRNLQTALDIDGRTGPKFATITTCGDSLADRTDGLWVRMTEVVRATNGQFEWGGTTYQSPCDGVFRFGLLSRPSSGATENILVPIANKGSAAQLVIPILWGESDNAVWVDTNVNGSFRDERGLRPNESVGVFGVDDPATVRRETVGFTVTVDASAKGVRLNLGWGGHATMTAGSAVGAGYHDGKWDGLAGKSRLAIFATSSLEDSYSVVEATRAAMNDNQVDVAFYEWSSLQFREYVLRDGKNALTVALDRVARRSNKLLFVPAGNSPGTNLTSELSLGEHLISVQAYDSRAALRLPAQIEAPASDNLHWVGSFGPAGDGALKPDLMAPASHVTTRPEFYDRQGPNRFPGVWELPYGLTIGAGTSSATPTAAAAAALIISAAKQTGVKYDAGRLRTALFSTARFCVGIQAHQQGRGLIQVGKAWALLKYLDKKADWEVPEIEVTAPVQTMGSRRLTPPDQGRGLFEREGWFAGDSGDREISITRKNGPLEPVIYELEWLSDSDAFTSARTLTLSLNKPTTLTVRIETKDAGAYSAILRLRPVGEPYEAKAVLHTIIAAERPAPTNPKIFSSQIKVPRPGVHSLYVHVPIGTKRLMVKASKESAETLQFGLLSPLPSHSPRAVMRLSSGEQKVEVVNPASGVWEILVENRAMMADARLLAANAATNASRQERNSRLKMEPRPNPLTPTEVNLEVCLD